MTAFFQSIKTAFQYHPENGAQTGGNPMSAYFQKTYQRSFGTFPLKGDELRDAMLIAAEIGYRTFDTAQMYGNPLGR
jgi:diketogulonate reductase-like aldo/keto reductase